MSLLISFLFLVRANRKIRFSNSGFSSGIVPKFHPRLEFWGGVFDAGQKRESADWTSFRHRRKPSSSPYMSLGVGEWTVTRTNRVQNHVVEPLPPPSERSRLPGRQRGLQCRLGGRWTFCG
ncbi:hypothetical protein BGZ63DRAFT_390441 [Mariannaea sp. PMI_226]|nr:hypothetical protein BGZ63DRAFT_390441 [Mariannaea sp. PMI_226]